MGKYFYVIGGYNTMVTKTVIRFDGKKWENICEITLARSALRVVLLKAWTDPLQILCDTDPDTNDTNSSICKSESSASHESNSTSEMTTASGYSD